VAWEIWVVDPLMDGWRSRGPAVDLVHESMVVDDV
jgi:hypothetical protein